MENESKQVEEGVGTTTPEAKMVSETSSSRPKKNEAFNLKIGKKTAFGIALGIVLLGIAFNFKSVFIAATVNGSIVTRYEVIRELEKQFGDQALNTILTKRLIGAEAEKQKIVVTSAEIDQEIEKAEAQIGKQGGTLEDVLKQQGMTVAEFREQIMVQKQVEKILGDKLLVTEEAVTQYIEENKLTPPTGTDEADFRKQVMDQLKNQKMSTEANKWVSDIRTKAEINYFVDYATPFPVPAAAPQE